MTLIITLPAETEKLVHELAARRGQDVNAYVQEVLQRTIQQEAAADRQARSAEKTLDEILAPVRQGFRESGLGETELEQLFEEARQEVWDEKHGKGAP